MSTPALARATEAHEEEWSGLVSEMQEDAAHGNTPMDEGEFTRRIVHATVSAALHDPDEGRDPVAEALCSHDESVHHMERTDDFPCSACVSAADAVRAAILGEA